MNLGQTLKENYTPKYIHKYDDAELHMQLSNGQSDVQDKDSGLEWNSHNIKVMQKLWVYSKSTLML